MDFPILSLTELDMPEDVIINYPSLIGTSSGIIITQDDIDFMTPILLEMSRILSRYR
jgi:hypothetical protein